LRVVQFNEKDVVRHNLVQQIIRAYEEFEVGQAQNRLAFENSRLAGRGKEPERPTARERAKEIPQK